MAATAWVIWLYACVRYLPDRGLVFEFVTCFYCCFTVFKRDSAIHSAGIFFFTPVFFARSFFSVTLPCIIFFVVVAFSPTPITLLMVRPAPRVKDSENQLLLVVSEKFKVGHKQFHYSFCKLILKQISKYPSRPFICGAHNQYTHRLNSFYHVHNFTIWHSLKVCSKNRSVEPG